jgi:hypothetical protein
MLAAISVLPLAAFACGGDGEETFDVGDGDVTVGEGLPDGWPDDFPVYGGADLRGGARGDVDGTEGLIATWETDDDVSDVVEFYTNELDDGTWRSVTRTSTGDGSLIAFEHDSDDRAGAVVIGEADGKTTIVVSIGEGLDIDDGDEPADGTDGGDGEDEDTPVSGDQPTEDDLPGAVDVPDTFPSGQVPLPDSAHVSQATSSTAGGVGSHVLQFYSDESADDIAAFFKSELEGNGFTETVRTAQQGSVFVGFSESPDASGMIVTITISQSEVPGFTSTILQVTDPE